MILSSEPLLLTLKASFQHPDEAMNFRSFQKTCTYVLVEPPQARAGSSL